MASLEETGYRTRISVAAALALAKPTGEANRDYIQRILASFASPQMSSSAPFLNGSDSAIDKSSDVTSVLNMRVLELEARLEKAEADADRARLDLSVHLIRSQIASGTSELSSLEATQAPSSQSTKQRSKRKVPAEGPESNHNITGSKKKKKLKAPIVEAEITLSTLLKHLGATPEAPLISSSFNVLDSLDQYLRLFQSQSSLPSSAFPRPKPSVALHHHISRAITSVSYLIHSSLGLIPRPPLQLPRMPLSHSAPHALVRACSTLLSHCISLSSNWKHHESELRSSRMSELDISVQVGRDIIDPLIRSFYTLSVRMAERVFRAQDSVALDSNSDTGYEYHIDLRKEVLNMLVQFLSMALSSVSIAAPQPQSYRHLSSSPDIPLSGTTAINNESPELDNYGSAFWTGDMMIHLTTCELLRMIEASSNSVAQNSAVGPERTIRVLSRPRSNFDPGPSLIEDTNTMNIQPKEGSHSSTPARTATHRHERSAVLKIAREDTVWYLCAVIHACLRACSGTATSRKAQLPLTDEVLVQTRHVLLNVLLADRGRRPSAQSADGGSKEPSGLLGMAERAMVYAAAEAVNGFCEQSWEG